MWIAPMVARYLLVTMLAVHTRAQCHYDPPLMDLTHHANKILKRHEGQMMTPDLERALDFEMGRAVKHLCRDKTPHEMG